MIRTPAVILAGLLALSSIAPAFAQTNAPAKPTWWAKYEYLAAHGPDTCAGQTGVQVGPNVDVSNECGPQSETYITIDPRIRRRSPPVRTRSSGCRCAATRRLTAGRQRIGGAAAAAGERQRLRLRSGPVARLDTRGAISSTATSSCIRTATASTAPRVSRDRRTPGCRIHSSRFLRGGDQPLQLTSSR